MLCEMQTASSSIRTQFAMSIYYEDIYRVDKFVHFYIFCYSFKTRTPGALDLGSKG